MDRCTRAVLHVRVRHLKRDLDWFLWITGTSVDESQTLMGAWYLLYVLAVLVVWAFLSWAALENTCAAIIGSLPTHFRYAPFALVLTMWLFVALVRAIQALWRSPFRLAPADVAWLSGSGHALVVMALSDVVLRCVGIGILGLMGGLLATTGMGSDLRLYAAFTSALVGICTLMLPCCVAEVRFVCRRRVPSLGVALIGACSLVTTVLCAAFPPAAFPPAALVSSLAIVCFLCVLFLLLERRVCVPLLVCESTLDVDPMTSFRMSLTNRALFQELARNKRLARRGPLILPPLVGRGWLSLISRAAIVLLRRFEGLGDIVFFGGICVPMLCATCLVPDFMGVLVPCAAGVVMSYRSAHTLVRVFCEDEDNRFMRSMLPVDPLRLLVADSLPALILAGGLSCLACSLVFAPLGLVVPACVICVLLDAATMFCGGLSRVVLPSISRRVSFEVAFFVVVVVTCLVSCVRSWMALVVVLSCLDALACATVYFGSDAAAIYVHDATAL